MNLFKIIVDEPQHIELFLDYVLEKHNIEATEATDIDEGNTSSNEIRYYYELPEDIIFDIDDCRTVTKLRMGRLESKILYQEIPHVFTLEEYIEQINIHLQREAESKGYDNIISACSYTNSANEQFRTESLRFVEIRDECWGTILDNLKTQLSNNNPPEMEYFVNSLPKFEI